MSEDGMEQKYVKEAFDTNWVVPLGPNVNGFEKDLEEFVNQNGKIACILPGQCENWKIEKWKFHLSNLRIQHCLYQRSIGSIVQGRYVSARRAIRQWWRCEVHRWDYQSKYSLMFFFTTTRPSLPKEGTSPHQTSHPHGERLKKIIAETDDYFYVLVSRDDAMIVYRLPLWIDY